MRLVRRGPLPPDEERALEGLISRARDALPALRQRYREGLAPGEMLFVTLRFRIGGEAWEQVFAEVRGWTDQGVTVVVNGDLDLLDRPKRGDMLTVSEDSICDWTIIKADNSEEGNFIGRYARGGRS